MKNRQLYLRSLILDELYHNAKATCDNRLLSGLYDLRSESCRKRLIAMDKWINEY